MWQNFNNVTKIKIRCVLSSNSPGLSTTSVGVEQAKEEMKRASIHGEINTFVLTMTGSPEFSIVKNWAPEKALFWPKMLKPTLKTPKNIVVTSSLLRKDFGRENGPHFFRPESPTPCYAIIWMNGSLTPMKLGVVSTNSRENNIVELNVLQYLEAPVQRKLFSSNEIKFQ